MSDESQPEVEGGDGLEELIDEADGLRQARRELLQEVEREKVEVSELERRVARAEQRAHIPLGSPGRIFVLLVLLFLAGRAGYGFLPTRLDLYFNSWGPGAPAEVKRLLKMIGLDVKKVSDDEGQVSVLFHGEVRKDDLIKIRHFLDRLIAAKMPQKPPEFLLVRRDKPEMTGAHQRLVMDFARGGVSPDGCHWQVPVRMVPRKGKGQRLPRGAERIWAVKSVHPAFEGVARRITFNLRGEVSFKLARWHKKPGISLDACDWKLLMGATDADLKLVLFPRMARKLIRYEFGKGLF